MPAFTGTPGMKPGSSALTYLERYPFIVLRRLSQAFGFLGSSVHPQVSFLGEITAA